MHPIRVHCFRVVGIECPGTFQRQRIYGGREAHNVVIERVIGVIGLGPILVRQFAFSSNQPLLANQTIGHFLKNVLTYKLVVTCVVVNPC